MPSMQNPTQEAPAQRCRSCSRRRVSRIVLNDKDRCIYAFWRAVLNQTGDFLDLIERTPLTVDEWHRQRAIYEKPWRHGQLAVGFATFYLNRCNRSGIIGGSGPIGGFDQTGNYKIDARFNRANLRDRVDRIATYRDRIEFHRLDALDFLRTIVRPITRRAVPCLVFLDPPYYAKGPKLYLNAYRHGDHAALARFLSRARFFNWVLTYDNVEEIRQLYQANGPPHLRRSVQRLRGQEGRGASDP